MSAAVTAIRAVAALDSVIDILISDRNELRYALQALYDTCDATPGTDAFKDYQVALNRAEELLKEPVQ